MNPHHSPDEPQDSFTEPFAIAFARWIEGFIKYPDTPRFMLMNCPTFLMVGAKVENELFPRKNKDKEL